MTHLSIPVQAKSLQDLQKKVKTVSTKADLIEIWLDHLPNAVTPNQIKKITKKPFIIVNKPKREKGAWRGNEEQRIERLIDALKAGHAYVDIGLDTDVRLIKRLIKSKKRGTKIIASFHNFKKTPSEEYLWKLIRKGFSLGADIVKIATFANSYDDSLKILNILNRARKRKLKVAAMCMGKYGKITRVIGPLYGSYLSFVALDKSAKTAPGQLTIDEYKKIITLVN